MEFNIELPINPLSFGQIGIGILFELYKRELPCYIWPTGNVDLSATDLELEFHNWVQKSISGAIKQVGKNLPYCRLWHLNGAEKSLPASRKILFTAHECSETTDVEKQICGLYDKVLFTSEYSRDIFKNSGVENAEYCPDFFDANHFKKIETRKQEGIINFSLIGKLEKRKNSHQIIGAWCQKYGGRHDSRLNTLLFNPFLPPEVQQRSIDSLFRGNSPFNYNPLPFQQKNSAVNEIINFCDVDISGLSGAEGWNLPAFNAAALGKQVIVLKGHGHDSWATEDNSILITPSTKQDIYDGVFFNKGADFNQGEMLCFDPQDVFKALEVAEQRVKGGIENTEGLKLQEKFSVKRTVDTILENMFG